MYFINLVLYNLKLKEMKHIFLPSIALLSLFVFSCKDNKTTEETINEQDTIDTTQVETIDSPVGIVLENEGITLTEVFSPEFPDSKLTIKNPIRNSTLDTGVVDFNFSIQGGKYTLGTQSADAATKGCANSGKGQHIHVILDNEPYEASYDTNYTTKASLEAGNHTALTFISRSYHESLKHEGAYELTQFTVGDQDGMDSVDLSAPHLFYSRPKGNYEAQNTTNVMLDFYLVNTEISEEGNYVNVTFNDSIEFNITKWAPYFIQGLPLGINKVRLQLMDNEGQVIPGPYNVVERQFTLVQ